MRLTYLNTYQALIYEYSLELNITTIWSLYLKQRKVNHYNNHNEKKQEVSKIFKVLITVTKLTEFYHLNFARIILTDS